jgi:two-component system phosphate regulon sensor histidine kinase PhoR
VANKFSIEEMIVNLLLNAIKYTPAKGAVEIRAIDKGDSVQIEVADTGIGIPADEIPRVFDEFFRGAKAKKMERDGTGLGLSIAKQIVKRHNGRIWVESTQGEGSTFKLTLPRNGVHC